jgi:hypothetical protein
MNITFAPWLESVQQGTGGIFPTPSVKTIRHKLSLYNWLAQHGWTTTRYKPNVQNLNTTALKLGGMKASGAGYASKSSDFK